MHVMVMVLVMVSGPCNSVSYLDHSKTSVDDDDDLNTSKFDTVRLPCARNIGMNKQRKLFRCSHFSILAQ